MEHVLFRHNKPGRPVTFAEYCSEGGFEALRKALGGMSPEDVHRRLSTRRCGEGEAPDSLRQEMVIRPPESGPRYLICNCDEMEPGTYKGPGAAGT